MLHLEEINKNKVMLHLEGINKNKIMLYLQGINEKISRKRDQVSDDEILAANETYGSLGELAIMALPKSQVLRIFCIGTFLPGPFY